MYKQSNEFDSESSSDDSKFLDGPLSKMHLQKKAAPVKQDEGKNGLDALFFNRNYEKKGIPKKTSSPGVVANPVEDDDLGFDPKQPKRTQKSMNLFSELLKETRPSNDNQPTISRQSTATTTDSSNIFNVSRPKTTAGRRSSYNASQQEITERPTTSNQESTKVAKSPRKTSPGITADWLGLHLDIVESVDSVNKSTGEETQLPQLPQQSTSSNKTGRTSDEVNVVEKSSSNKTAITYEIVSDEDSDTSASEPEDDKIKYLLQKHANLLKQQEKDYEEFIKKQILIHKKFKQLDETQQNRLIMHFTVTKQAYHKLIKASMFSNETQEIKQEVMHKNSDVCSAMMDACQKDIEIKRLQLENQRLEALLANVNTNTAREIEALNASHKTQTTILEEHCAKLENYFRQETDTKARYYEEKIEQMKTQNKEQSEYYERSLMLMRNSHEKDKKLIADTYTEHMDILKSEHQKILEILQNIHTQEMSFRQDKNSYGKILQESANSIDVLNKKFHEFSQEMREKVETLSKERDHQLSLREKQLETTERMLKEAYEKSKDTIGHIQKDYEGKIQEKSENESYLKAKSAELLKRESELSHGFARLEAEKSAFLVNQAKELKEFAQRVAQLDENSAKFEEEKGKIVQILENHKLEKKRFDRERAEIRQLLNNIKLRDSKLDEERAEVQALKHSLNELKKQLTHRESKVLKLENSAKLMWKNANLREQTISAKLEKNNNEQKTLQNRELELERRTKELNKREEHLTSQQAELCQERVKLLQKSKEIETGPCVLCRLHLEYAKVDALVKHKHDDTPAVPRKIEQKDNVETLNVHSSTESIFNSTRNMFVDNTTSDFSA